ncbi:hypothetical protein OGAPHI_002000 [Ogataea philodendri]|uniref:Uncharacterized protein n=1 Tax=Ogataea philodendri TaxID=1378263 RepID=A0A9P8PAM2_9ASCO|nr:uncharacterized protein OGAPHI_002000 [Ogataea philodendri]KAH3668246.1 hypothetical protein OGAPHI_002000 [Ogataea philodendri]
MSEESMLSSSADLEKNSRSIKYGIVKPVTNVASRSRSTSSPPSGDSAYDKGSSDDKYEKSASSWWSWSCWAVSSEKL